MCRGARAPGMWRATLTPVVVLRSTGGPSQPSPCAQAAAVCRDVVDDKERSGCGCRLGPSGSRNDRSDMKPSTGECAVREAGGGSLRFDVLQPQTLKCAHLRICSCTKPCSSAVARCSGRAHRDEEKSWPFCSNCELGARGMYS